MGGSVKSEFDAIVVGAGFAGMYSLHRLKELGLSIKGFELANFVFNPVSTTIDHSVVYSVGHG